MKIRLNSIVFLTILFVVALFMANATLNAFTTSSPTNDTWTADLTPNFAFNATSYINTTFTCELYIQNSSAWFKYGTNSTVANATLTVITANASLEEGARNWYVNCTDVNASNVSTTYVLNVDATNPAVSNLTMPANNSNVTGVEFNFTATDNYDTTLNYTLFLNDVANATGQTSANNTATNFTVTGLINEAIYNWTLQVMDDASNAANYSGLFYFKVDSSNPAVSTLNAPANNTWTSTAAVTFNFTATDNVDPVLNFTLYVNDATNVTGATSANNTAANVTVSFAEGRYNWTVEVSDDATNAANYSGLYYFVYDNTNPAVTALNEPANNSNATGIEFNFTATDNIDTTLNYTLFLNDVANATGQTSANNTATNFSVTGLTEGSIYNWTLQVMDDASNAANFSGLYYFKVDDSSPTINNLTLPANNTWTSTAAVTFNFTTTDNNDLNLNYTLFINGVGNTTAATTGNNSATNVTISFAEGRYNWTVNVTDDSSNTGTYGLYYFVYDNTNPAVSALTTPANNSNVTGVEFNFTATDNIDTTLNYTLYINQVINTTGQTTANNTAVNFTVSGLTNEGIYNWTVEVTDDASNAANFSGMYYFKVDDTAPTIHNYTLPANNTWTSTAAVTFNFTTTDNNDRNLNYTLFVNGVSNTTASTTGNNSATNVTISFADGRYNWSINATDDAGNAVTSLGLYYFVVDSTNPAVSALNGPTNNSIVTGLEFNFTATDNIDTTLNYTLYLNQVINATGQTSANNTAVNFTVYGLENEAIYNWTIEVMDDASNAANFSGLYYFRYDNTSPVVQNLTMPVNMSNVTNGNVVFNFTATDNIDNVLNYTMYLDTYTNMTGQTTGNNSATNFTVLRLTNGTFYNWTIEVTDDAGNAANYSGLYYFTVLDSTYPNTYPTLTQAGVNDSDDDGNIELSWTADSQATYYRVYRNSSNVTDVTNLVELANVTVTSFEDNTTENGTTYWYGITSVDGAGLENTTAVSVTYNATANDSFTPKSPTNVNLTTNGNGSITINWTSTVQDVGGNAEANNLTYRVFRTSNFSALNTSVSTENIANTSNLYHEDTTATTGTLYSYVVTVIDDANNFNSSITATNHDNATAVACTTTYNYTAWTSCANGEQNRTGLRTCYGGGSTTATSSRTCSSGSSSSSSGGGGSSSSSDETSSETTSNPKAIQIWNAVNKDTATTMKVSNDEIDVTEVTLTVINNVYNAKVTIEKLPEKPSSVGKASDKVYRYLTIDTTNIDDADLKGDAFIKFKVEKSWLNDNSIDENNVVLLRFTSKWKELETTRLSSDSTYVYYRAKTPGFSYFAIAEKELPEVTEEPEEVVEEEPEPTPVVEEVEETKDSNLTTVFVVLALVLIGLFMFFKGKKGEHPVRDYVVHMRSKGHKDEHIKKKLKDAGHKQKHIEKHMKK